VFGVYGKVQADTVKYLRPIGVVPRHRPEVAGVSQNLPPLGGESVRICKQLKMLSASDDKTYNTDAEDAENHARKVIMQSVPGLKAEPIKRWLAKAQHIMDHMGSTELAVN
jgi:hypothetical protein